MIHLISQAITRISSFLKTLQIKSFLATFLVGLILLSTTYTPATNGRSANDISNKVFESNSERPTTTNEWYQQARRTEDQPLERAKEIGKESAQAVKEWGSVYPDTAERTAPDTLADS